ncbi:transposase [bacterium]|nr:transposase [bacterium]
MLCWGYPEKRTSYHFSLEPYLPSDEFSRGADNPRFKTKIQLARRLIYDALVKDIPGKVNVCVAIGKWDAKDPKGVHIFVTNDLKLNAKQIVKKYALRWGIELMFRDLKENVGFDHYQVRSIRGITRHWYLCFLAYSFLIWIKLNGYCQRAVDVKPKTMGEHLLLFRNLNSLTCQRWIAHNPFHFKKFLRTRGMHPLEQPAIF